MHLLAKELPDDSPAGAQLEKRQMAYEKKTDREQKIVEDALKNNPELSTHGVARLLHEKHPKIFPTHEIARSRVRYLRGGSGNEHRKCMTNRKFVRGPQPGPVAQPAVSDALPESAARPAAPFVMATERTLVLGDIHLPYHDRDALELALKYGEERGIDGIVLLGDIVDCHTISSHVKDPEARSFSEELTCARQFLRHLRQRFPEAKIVYREGNHEARQQRYMMTRAPELIGCSEFRMDVLLGLFDLGIDYVSEKRRIKMGDYLTLLHGDEFIGNFGGVNPARNMFMKAKTCVMSGHNHRTSEHTERALDDRVVTCWSIGCLCDMQPLYMPYNNWNLGFALVSLEDNDFRVENKRIIKAGGKLSVY